MPMHFTPMMIAFSISKNNYLSLETFKACIDKIPTHIRVDFSGMAEPWLNKNCSNMVLYAAQRGHKLVVYTTLVGMTVDDFE